MEKVCWRVNGIFNADAQKVFEEISTLEKITPEKVLEYGKDENSELHKCFEWDDSIAAQKFRLQQAGNIIRMIRVEVDKPELPKVRVFSLTSEKSTYAPTRMMMKVEDEYKQLLKRAYAELQAFKEKYITLSELEKVFEEIDSLI